MPVPMYWAGTPVVQHVAAVEEAQRRYGFLTSAIGRVYHHNGWPHDLREVIVTPLAVGGAMAVYKITVAVASQQPQRLVCKIPHQRQLVYTAAMAGHSADEATQQLLDRLVALADHLAQRAPGIFPRCGGVWHWRDQTDVSQHLLVEEFIPGLSVERLLLQYEQQFLTGELDAMIYQQHRLAAQRLAIATFTRLWDALDRRLFTSDPSPWNILVRHPDDILISTSPATIIDLHGLEEEVGLAYVVQRLAAVYGMRQDVLEQALIPGILDALGAEEGRSELLAELPQLEAEAERLRRNLGVDAQQPLLRAVRALA